MCEVISMELLESKIKTPDEQEVNIGCIIIH